jgi:tRNA A-37 threonylcarbamoyl transferase component Bud32
LVILEDYALRFLRDAGIRVARSYGIVELTPNAEYMLVTEFFEHARRSGDSEVDEVVIDEDGADPAALGLGVAHRDIKPANLLVKDGHLQLVDVSGLEIRPSPWRQAVDLANMMLTLALQSDADTVYARAIRVFTPDEIAEGFASAVEAGDPTQLRARLKADERPLLARFRAGAVEGTDLDPAVERPTDRHHRDRRVRRAHAHRVARGLGARRDQLRSSDRGADAALRVRRFADRSAAGSLLHLRGCHAVTIFATAVTRNSCPTTASITARDCPGFWSARGCRSRSS